MQVGRCVQAPGLPGDDQRRRSQWALPPNAVRPWQGEEWLGPPPIDSNGAVRAPNQPEV